MPVVAGAIRLTERSRGEKLLWLWLVGAVAMSITMLMLGLRDISTARFTQLTYPLYGGLGLHAIAVLAGSPRLKLWIHRGIVAYLIWWLGCMLAGEFGKPFASYSGPILWIIFVGAAAGLILSALHQDSHPPLRNPRVLIGLAILVTIAPSAALEPAAAVLYAKNPVLTSYLYVVRGLLVLVGLFLFTLALSWTTPRRNSGSSSSAVERP